jgi:hypothetical protein
VESTFSIKSHQPSKLSTIYPTMSDLERSCL